MNGRKVGEKAWNPVRVHIATVVRTGAISFKIVFSNSDANSRAVASHRQLLKNIDLKGLLGPVRIAPRVDLPLTQAER